jgi:hypothetical protein
MSYVTRRGAMTLAAVLILAACRSQDGAELPPDFMLTARGLGPVRLCAPLDSVGALLAAVALGGVRDSVFVGEDESKWPGKVVVLAGGGTAEFEGSWMDSVHVWRISTTARRASTMHGVRVGDALGTVPAGSGPLRAEVPEGQLLLVFTGDSVAALLDSTSERAYYARKDDGKESLRALPKGARVRMLMVSGDCRALTPAS